MIEKLYLFWQLFGDRLFPLLWSGSITLFCSIVFWTVRWYFGSKPGFGTETFSLLFAADLSVALGTCEVWLLTAQTWPQHYYQWVAGLLMVATVVCSVISVRLEHLSATAKRDYDKELRQVALGGLVSMDPGELWNRYTIYWAKAYFVRWATITLHLWWIVKTPRWVLL